MQAQVEELGDSKVRLTVEVPRADVKHAVEHAASDLAGSVKIPGFRKGKVPLPVLVNRIGKDRLYTEAVESHIGGWFWNAAAQTRIRPVEQPEYGYELPDVDAPSWQFTATVAVQPKPDLPDWSQTPVSQSQPIAATLDVRGSFGSSQFRYRLGDGGPMEFALRIPRASPNAKLQLVVTAIPPSRLLRPPGASTWAEAVRRGRIDESELLERISQARLTIARALQYQTFLSNPNSTGDSTAVYVYETAKRTATAKPATSAKSSDSSWPTILFAALAVVGAGGLVVLWANS